MMLNNSAMRVHPHARSIFAGVVLCAIAAGVFAQQAPDIPRFSTARPSASPGCCQVGASLAGWQHGQLASFKNETMYNLAVEDGTVALKATAHNAASFVGIRTDFDPHQFPMLSWRWKVVQGIPAADTADPKKEDAPVRVMVSFAGDSSKLPLKDRLAASAAQSISGQALPYAELMYVWGGKVAVNSITVSGRTSRVRMLAVAADDQGIGRWHSYTRNLVEDFKRAFGEEPGNVTSIQLMTDTDNTGGDAEALYGDIVVQPAKP